MSYENKNTGYKNKFENIQNVFRFDFEQVLSDSELEDQRLQEAEEEAARQEEIRRQEELDRQLREEAEAAEQARKRKQELKRKQEEEKSVQKEGKECS